MVGRIRLVLGYADNENHYENIIWNILGRGVDDPAIVEQIVLIRHFPSNFKIWNMFHNYSTYVCNVYDLFSELLKYPLITQVAFISPLWDRNRVRLLTKKTPTIEKRVSSYMFLCLGK